MACHPLAAAMRALAALALLLVLPVAGCIGSSNAPQDTGTSSTSLPAANATLPKVNVTPVELAVSTTGQYPVNPGFDPATLKVAAGSLVHVTFTDAEQLPLVSHDLVFEKIDGAKSKTVDAGGKTDFTFTAPAKGTYKYFCDIGDHRSRGMEGTLTVE
jgi:plastocyanin